MSIGYQIAQTILCQYNMNYHLVVFELLIKFQSYVTVIK